MSRIIENTIAIEPCCEQHFLREYDKFKSKDRLNGLSKVFQNEKVIIYVFESNSKCPWYAYPLATCRYMFIETYDINEDYIATYSESDCGDINACEDQILHQLVRINAFDARTARYLAEKLQYDNHKPDSDFECDEVYGYHNKLYADSQALLRSVKDYVKKQGGFISLSEWTIYGITTSQGAGGFPMYNDVHHDVRITALKLTDKDTLMFFAVDSDVQNPERFDPNDSSNELMWFTLFWDLGNPYLHNLHNIAHAVAQDAVC